MSEIPTLGGPGKAFQNILNTIIATEPHRRIPLIREHLLKFISHPVIKEIVGDSPDPATPHNDTANNLDLQKIQDTLTSLTKAIDSLKKAPSPPNNRSAPKASKAKGVAPSPPNQRTYLAIAGSRPPNPSLVVDLDKYGIGKDDRVKPESLCQSLNEKLAAITPPQIQLVAVRWTAKGNLVVTGGPAATPQSLQTAAPHIGAIISLIIPSTCTTPIPQPRANVKWPKILLNSVPTGASKDRAPYSPDECHSALTATNPAYSSLSIMQKPSWVRPPSSYTQGTISSLSVAFEDPDGTKLKAILTDRYLYAFGTRIAVKKWKYCQNKHKVNSKQNAAKHNQDSEEGDEEDIEITLTPQPAARFTSPAFGNVPIDPALSPFRPRPPSPTPNPPRRTRSKGQARA